MPTYDTDHTSSNHTAVARLPLAGRGRPQAGNARRLGRALRRSLRRALSVLLTISLLSASAPAAPRVANEMASNARLGLALWWQSSGWSAAFRNFFSGQRTPSAAQEKQSARDARVASIQVAPGEATVLAGETVRFTAVAYDQRGVPVSGVRFKWRTVDAERNRRVRLTRDGEFMSRIEGTYQVVAEAGGREAQATVKVLKVQGGKRDEKPSATREISTRDLPPVASALSKRRGATQARRAERPSGSSLFVKASYGGAPKPAAPAAPAYLPANEWNQDNYMYADDPGNERGDPPGSPQDEGAGSGNFQMALPVLTLPGRGIDLGLDLVYNSRVWSKSGSEMTFDIDKDWPAPGWSLGFGKMVGMNTSGSMLIEADGTRRSFTGTVTSYSWGGTYFDGRTTDGTLIDYWSYSYNGNISSGWAKLPNGTVIDYGAAGNGSIYPTRVLDPNGNYLTITYVNNQGPRIQTITDTLGRAVNFHYDGYGLLTAVTAPGLGGGTRTLVRLHYRQHTLQYGFAYWLTPRVRDHYPWVIDAVYYPGTNTGYWFGDGDSYSTYGMISKVSERRAMGFWAGSLNEQGSVTSAGAVTQQQVYNYPLTPDYGLADAPTYTTRTHTWDGMDTGPAVTTYVVNQNSTPRRTEIIYPNGTRNVQLSFNAPGQWHDGLVYQDETRDSNNALAQSSTVTWQQGAYSSPRPVRMEMTDERGQMTATEFSYGPVYNQVTEVRNYDYGGASLVRVTRTSYENGAAYTNRHIFNLTKTAEVFAADGVTRLSRTEYVYDGQPLADTPGVVQHDESHNPHAQDVQHCEWVQVEYCDPWMGCYYQWEYQCTTYNPYNAATAYRGNVTQVKTYANAAALDHATAVVETQSYDRTGNMVSASTACCEQSAVGFTLDTQYAYPQTQTRGSATDPAARLSTSASYDFGTGLPLSVTDVNGRTTQTVYFADTLRPQEEVLSSGARTVYAYNDADQRITQTTYTAAPGAGGVVANQNVKTLNGLGLVRREEALGVNAWDVVETRYDQMGRLWQQSRPYRGGQEQPRWSEVFYDALGRIVKERAPDGSESLTFYNEPNRPAAATTLPGQTTRVADAWGRERWGRVDAVGRLVEVVEPDANGAGSVANHGSRTTYAYDALDNLVEVVQGSQTRRFRYDSLGRLTHQKLAERSATLNDAGQYVGVGGYGAQWSDVYAYDTRSNLTTRVDARGVTTTYSYNNDPLGRLQGAAYSVGASYDSSSPIPAAAAVTFAYMTGGDVTRPRSVRAAGISTEEYAYDFEGRMSEVRLTLDSRPSHPMVINSTYDSLDRLTDVVYPAQYGAPGSPRKTVHHDYDVASRLTGLQVNGVSYASEFAYNASSQTTSLKVGAGTGVWKREEYDFDPATGLLRAQRVLRDGITPILNLEYDYLRPGTSSGRTGHLTKVINHLDRNKDRGYEYDALGRLKRATGGQNVVWAQRYNYDGHGNRMNVYSYTAEQYVRNFYQSALGRQPTAGELQTWLDQLRAAYPQGASQFLAVMQNLGDHVFGSAEYAARGRSDRDYVYDLYKAYLYREPDQGGWDFWTGTVPGSGRPAVRNAFAQSWEFHLKVSGTSPYSPAGGAVVPRDGWEAITFDSGSNRINLPGYTYDAAGNLTRGQAPGGAWQRYEYDAANRLVRVKDDWGNVLVNYTYGPTNARLVGEEGGTRTYYVWGGGGVITEYTESGGSASPWWSKNYIYLGGRLLATQQPGGAGEFVQYHHPDRLGTRVVSNAADAGWFEQSSLPFGTALAAESTGATNRRFTSYDRSPASGLDYALNRLYDSSQGRFTQVDPLDMDAVDLGDPQTLNLYAYCGNDPVNHTDPDGLFFKKLFRWIGKLFKWVATAIVVATMVVMAAIMFAPAGSFIFKAALWIFGKVLLPLSQIPGIGAMVPIGALGTPPWNPSSRGFSFSNSWQEDVVRVTTSCPDNYPAPGPNATKCPGAPWYKKLWGAIKSGVGSIVEYVKNNPLDAAVEVAMTFIPAGWVVRGIRWGIRGVRWGVRAIRSYRAARAAKAISRTVNFTTRQLQSKFKHAPDFGITGNYNAANATRFQQALEAHVANPATRVISGTYRGQPVIHFVDPATGLNVITSPAGQFISGWRLNPAQLTNVLTRGSL